MHISNKYEWERQFHNISFKVPDKNIPEYLEINSEIDYLNEIQELSPKRLENLRKKLKALEI
jgi:hypothetical protein